MRALLILLLWLWLALTARADFPDPLITVEVSSAAGTAQWIAPLSDGVWDPPNRTLHYQLAQPVTLYAPDGVALATLEHLALRLVYTDEPRLVLAWTIKSASADVVVQLVPAFLDVGKLAPLEAQACASLGLQDLGADGAAMRSVGPPGTGIVTFATHAPTAPRPALFASLLAELACGPGGSVSVSQCEPPVGSAPLPADVRYLSVRADFSLSRLDVSRGMVSFLARRIE